MTPPGSRTGADRPSDGGQHDPRLPQARFDPVDDALSLVIGAQPSTAVPLDATRPAA
ncbi:hypothetical protein [Clavibacter michiganensis]|uniref:hypothetical protein n=1 Tax=Clavibacter michiganensis TaxID=28447 RepID=UPI003DA1C6D6